MTESEARAAWSIQQLRERIASDAGSLMVFLGAGLSFGVGRVLGRAGFETPPPLADESRFPSWPLLIDRMRTMLIDEAGDEHEKHELDRFMRQYDPLDAAQLFRVRVGADAYTEFIRGQFETRPTDRAMLTPSHDALTRLPLRELFTTNYDSLIEMAFEESGPELVVSTTPREFLRSEVERPEHHLIKLHGTWDRPSEIVLTRDDYARSRLERAEMFRHFAQTTRFATFLFIGFSLSDPTFNLIRDEARSVMGDAMPTSFLVQERVDSVTRGYLASLNIEAIVLGSWNGLPRFLHMITP